MPMQRSFDVHPRMRQSRLVPERLDAALRAAGRGRVMAPAVTRFGAVNPGAQGGDVTSYDPTADRPGSMVYVQINSVQCALNAHGSQLVVDGVWGPRTAAALADFVSLALTPALGAEGASAAPAPPATLAFVAPSAGGTAVKMSPYLKSALLEHTDVASCVADGATSATAAVVPTTTAPVTTVEAIPRGGPPTWLYVVVGVGAAIGLGAWAMSATKRKRR